MTANRGLIWTTSPLPAKDLKRDGYTVVRFGDLRRSHIEPARGATTTRTSLARAAESLLKLMDSTPKLAVLGVPANTSGDIADIYSYLVEPAFRRDIDLFLGVDREYVALSQDSIDPGMGYPWSRERLNHLSDLYRLSEPSDGLPPLTPIEQRLFTEMRSRGLTPQAQYGIGPYRVDFAFLDVRLAVEADGRAWHDAVRDAARDARLRASGWEVLRFTGSRINREAPEVASEISAFIDHRRETVAFYSTIEETRVERSWWRRFLDWILRRPRVSTESSQFTEQLEEATVSTPTWKAALDAEQGLAVNASDGVIQIIAPAGSGKTTTMIARVQELLSRGIPANRILSTTFNKASVEELDKRLKLVGVTGTEVRNFHSLGRLILKEEGVLRSEIGTASYGQLRRIAKLAMDGMEGGAWIDAPAASELISDFKLAKMWTPSDARQHAGSDLIAQTGAEIYRLYEEELEQADRHDFDDLVMQAVRLLQTDENARRRWQDRWDCVLVDEFQDIEPAQELLIRLVAAPEDSIFAVGDEDQCIYSWRRASIERIVMFDTVYPGLDRVLLTTSYRCPPAITEAATKLISHNKRRFPKQIKASPLASSNGTVRLVSARDEADGSMQVAELLRATTDVEGTVVLARTSRMLQELVRTCVSEGVAVRAPASALRPTDAEKTVLAYLRIANNPVGTDDEDIRQSFRVPNRYLPAGFEVHIAQSLRSGATFSEAIASKAVPIGEEWRSKAMSRWTEVMDALGGLSGRDALTLLRNEVGGLDRHYASVEQMTPHDQVEIEVLEDISRASQDKTLDQIVLLLEQRILRPTGVSTENGIELATIHGAKGREWNTVILFGADADQLPHTRALTDATNEHQLEEAIEDERRLAYVAITRTKDELILVTTGPPSPFLREAGVVPTGPPLPTLQAIRDQEARAIQEQRNFNTDADSVGKPNPRPSTQAKFNSICVACNKAIEQGAPIVRNDDRWVHAACGS